MSISTCMICTKNRRPVQKYHHLFTSDCIGCSTRNWQEKDITAEKWQEICLTPRKADQDKNSQSSRTESAVPILRTQYLQIGYKPSKQQWKTKALQIFDNFIRRRSSAARNSSEQSKDSSETPSGVETTQKRSEAHCENKTLLENKLTAQDETNVLSSNDSSETGQLSKTRVIGPANVDFDDGQESSLDVLALMQISANPVPASDQTLSLKCCCSDADLTKPSMCGDRACVSCNVHDHRLVPRQVSIAAEAAAQAAASVLAVPQVQVDHDASYTSASTTPVNTDIHSVLHCVRSALENRLRCNRTSLLIQQTDVSTCTTPSTQESTMNPILLTLGKMYQKNLYLSALLHNLSCLDVKKVVTLVNECREKIEQLEEVCRQKNEPVIEKKTLIDVGVGEGEVKRQIAVFDVAVGEEDARKEKLDKGTQDTLQIDKVDSQTETANFGIEAGVQVSDEVGESGGREQTSEDQWRMSQVTAGLSAVDLNSINYCRSYLEPFLSQFENLSEPENSFHEIQGSSFNFRPPEALTSKTHAISTQKIRQSKPTKTSSRPPIRHSSLLSHSPSRLRSNLARQVSHSPPRHGIPLAAIQTHPVPRQQPPAAVSSRFAGGRSVMNHYPVRRGLAVSKKPPGAKFASTLGK